jgi:hypothetical protein
MPEDGISIRLNVTKEMVLDGLTELLHKLFRDLALQNTVYVETLVLVGISVNMSVTHQWSFTIASTVTGHTFTKFSMTLHLDTLKVVLVVVVVVVVVVTTTTTMMMMMMIMHHCYHHHHIIISTCQHICGIRGIQKQAVSIIVLCKLFTSHSTISQGQPI